MDIRKEVAIIKLNEVFANASLSSPVLVLTFIAHRYHEFRALRKELTIVYAHLSNLPFPRKHWFFNLSETTLRERQVGLNEFLRTAIALDPQPRELGR